jgi:hemerythrin
MPLEWRDAMSIDSGVIDEDHKCLIGLINDVAALRPGPKMPMLVEVAIARLLTYAEVHFQREERLQVAAAFTFAQAHRSRHRSIVRDMDAMLADCKQLPLDALPQFHARLCDYLFDWLRDHILKSDMQMKPFVADLRRHAAHLASLPDDVRTMIDNDRPQMVKPHRQLPLASCSSPHWRI